jgi:hypothetical protein
MSKKYSVLNLIVVAITALMTIVPITLFQQQQADAFKSEEVERVVQKAPIAISGDNIYVVWWTNKTANGDGEVMFRASNDSGATFGDKINLSNNTVTNSVDAEIAAADGDVVVTWWERNSTSNEPVMKVSSDNGQTFSQVLKLATNGTIATGGQ